LHGYRAALHLLENETDAGDQPAATNLETDRRHELTTSHH